MWEFPESWERVPALSGWIDDAVDWVVVNGDPIFDFINIVILRHLMGPPVIDEQGELVGEISRAAVAEAIR